MTGPENAERYTPEEELAVNALTDLQRQLSTMTAAEGFVTALLALEVNREFWTDLISRWLALPDVPDDQLRQRAQQFSESSQRAWEEALKQAPTPINRNGRTPLEGPNGE